MKKIKFEWEMDNLPPEKLYRIKVGQLIMMIDRGFDLQKFDDSDKRILQGDFSEEELLQSKIYHNRDLQPPTQYSNLPSFCHPTISINIVYYFIGESVKAVLPDQLFEFLKDNREDIWGKSTRGHKVITAITTNEKTKAKVVKAISILSDFNCQVFTVDEIIQSSIFYPPTKHFLIPDAIKLTAEEVSQLSKELQDNKWSLESLPMMSKDDPFARFHGLFYGEIVAFFRASGEGSIIQNSVGYRRITLIETKT
jgi:DNA-directed RNA polymerase subunit H (RpoH/RPB5)